VKERCCFVFSEMDNYILSVDIFVKFKVFSYHFNKVLSGLNPDEYGHRKAQPLIEQSYHTPIRFVL